MQKLGKTYILDNPVIILGAAGVAGKKEGEGPLAQDFDVVFEDTAMGQDSYELAESAMLKQAVQLAISKSGVQEQDIDFILAGDLLDQCTGSCFAVMDFGIPFLGMYGACSTMALTMCNASLLLSAGANLCVVGASSHFASSERQFRFPLEYGGQRTPTAQWTVTGAGSMVLKNSGNADLSEEPGAVKICAVHIGTITDLGITDANNMGAAMAPAAARTISEILHDTNTTPDDYDLILTGDLGFTGTRLLYELLEREYGINICPVHKDCGLMIYDLEGQDVNSGGSGCGCSASVLCSHIIKNMKNGSLKKVLFVATGALMSPTSTKQGRTIPGIAHAVILEG